MSGNEASPSMNRRQVKNDINFLHHFLGERRIFKKTNLDFDLVRDGAQVRPYPAREIISDYDACSSIHELLNQVAADERGATSYKHPLPIPLHSSRPCPWIFPAVNQRMVMARCPYVP